MKKKTAQRVVAGLGIAACLAVTACGGGSDPGPVSSGNASQGTTTADIAFWDPYPQHTDGSAWDDLVKSCAPEGSTITRSSAAQTDLFNQLTTAVREGTAPDIVVLDNPMVPEAVAAGLLATADQAGIDTAGVDENLLGPGVVDGTAYGVPFGSNALGLYYNADLLSQAGIDPASITSWDALNAALEKATASGSGGITFSGVTGEEGVFQFLPWFWGSGADLGDIASDDAIAAGQLISGWVGKGWAPKSVITDNQSAAWDLFLTGQYAFAENGSWFAAAAQEADFAVGVLPIPSRAGGVAPVPTGGEFAVAPVQTENASDHYANAAAVISCLTEGDAGMTTNETLGYLSAKPEVRAEQVRNNPVWEPWVASVEGAQGRTTDLGADYVVVSGQLSEAIQGALNAAGNADAVSAAFNEAAGR
ncbi:MAG TPA: extracellular solute-binding protein [Arachnia sp.]|nr:extracellular solute-binding protein [Arachnia sp.]HMT85293.1 extracellular solute-binding protein [Arachnia sp.]